MKSTGIVRRIDDLGRVVIPKELRNTRKINKKDPMEIYVDGDKIIFKKYEPGCDLCGEVENIEEFNGKNICVHCIDDIKKIV